MDEALRIAVLRERASGETRVAVTPETVRKFTPLGAKVAVEQGAGLGAAIADADYTAAGGLVGASGFVTANAAIVLAVQAPGPELLEGVQSGAWIAGMLDPLAQRERIEAYAAAGFEALAMEWMPRITRAQSMDVLSSQSNLAGYKAVIDAADLLAAPFR